MDRQCWNPLNRHSLGYSGSDVYLVRIERPGPRGGKRPPLWEGYVRQRPHSFNDAVEDAWADLRSATKESVSCQP